MRKKKEPDPVSGGPKTCGSESGPNTVILEWISRLLPLKYGECCVHRLPVVSPALNPQEAAMMEMLRQVELEDSMLSDHEVRHKSVFYVIFRPFGVLNFLVVCVRKKITK
jgi:hypothetical protein